jgi:hypothetical protein
VGDAAQQQAAEVGQAAGAEHDHARADLTGLLQYDAGGEPPMLVRTAPSAVTPVFWSSSTTLPTSCWASGLSPPTVGGTG